MPLFIKNIITLVIIAFISHTMNAIFAGIYFRYTDFIGVTTILVNFFLIYIVLLGLNFFYKKLISDSVLVVFNIYFNTWLIYVSVYFLIYYFLKRLCQAEISGQTHNFNLIISMLILVVWQFLTKNRKEIYRLSNLYLYAISFLIFVVVKAIRILTF